MARINNLSNFLIDIENAIRIKKGTSDLILAEDFDTEIKSNYWWRYAEQKHNNYWKRE